MDKKTAAEMRGLILVMVYLAVLVGALRLGAHAYLQYVDARIAACKAAKKQKACL